MKLFVCLHNQLGAISRLRYLSESASHLLSLPVSESIFQLPLPPLEFVCLLFVCLSVLVGLFAWEDLGLEHSLGSDHSQRGFCCAQSAWARVQQRLTRCSRHH